MAYTYTPIQNTPAMQLINSIGGRLAPMKPISQVLPYSTYSQPQNTLFNTFQNQAKEEFNRNTYNPYLENMTNTLMSNNANMLGGGQNALDVSLRQVQMPFYNQLEQARQGLDTQTRNLYNQQIGNYYNSPNAFTNLSNPYQLK